MSLATSLLGTHIKRRSGGGRALAKVLLSKSQTEIGNVRFAGDIQQQVARLDVSMHQALSVGMV